MITPPLLCRDAAHLSPLVLAFVGDSVQTLYVRTRLAVNSDSKSGKLHKLAAAVVNAGAQARSYESAKGLLLEEELDIYKRARNSKTSSSAKNASITDYRKATGMEAVLGYLFLTGQCDRLELLLKLCFNEAFPDNLDGGAAVTGGVTDNSK